MEFIWIFKENCIISFLTMFNLIIVHQIAQKTREVVQNNKNCGMIHP